MVLAKRHYLMDHGLIVYPGTNEESKANNEVKDRYLALSSLAWEFSENRGELNEFDRIRFPW